GSSQHSKALYYRFLWGNRPHFSPENCCGLEFTLGYALAATVSVAVVSQGEEVEIASSIRLIAMSIHCLSISIPRNLRRKREQAIAVVPLPINGSSTRSFSLLEESRILSNRARGFWVGCFPWRFSQRSGAGSCQTLFICLPPAISLIAL